MKFGEVLGGRSPSGLVARLVVLGLVLLVPVVFVACCMTRIDAAHVGIRVKMAGTSRGIDDIPVVTGWVFYNPISEQIVQFPTSVINVVWTKDAREGKAHDESITFSSVEGVNVNADIGMSFHIDGSAAPHLYLRFHEVDLTKLADGYIRNAMREAFNQTASKMPVQEIYGAGKGKLLADTTAALAEQLNKDGILIDQLTINGALRLPENVAAAINSAMEATQLAIQAENRVRQVRAEAEQEVTKADGAANAARSRAKGEADARLITAKAEARANLVLRYSTTATVLQYRALEKWNGKLPVMNGGGALPLLTFDVAHLAKGGEDDEKKLRELLGDDSGDGAAEEAAPPPKDGAPPPPAPQEKAK
jgi:regulator of protease activity HflC (stomatin/prohibitin superfamily)